MFFMQNKFSFLKALIALTVSCPFSTITFAQTSTLPNASFDTYIAAADSFASWEYEKDATGGTLFDISQETTDPYSAPGCLKMAIAPGADTSTTCSILGTISGLTAGNVVTITAMVKYADMPTYWNSMINLQQATLTSGTWVWTDRKWKSMWGNNPGTAEWARVSMSDTTVDSANVFQLIISLHGSGTIWVDDIAIATAGAPVIQKAVQPVRRGSIANNRIAFTTAMPYTLEVYGVNGKTALKRSSTASSVDFNRLNLNSGAYAIRVKTADKTWSGRVLIGK